MRKDIVWSYVYIAVMAALFVGFFFVQPYFEMNTFNKYKAEDQPEATYFDAMFSQLRITAEEDR